MLEKIVRPLVKTQINLLANSEATEAILRETITRWLSYLGVTAQVKTLEPITDKIVVSLVVGQPTCCEATDWQKILTNLYSTPSLQSSQEISPDKQRKLARLIAYLIQIGTEEESITWQQLEPTLRQLNLSDNLLAELKAAIKVQQSKHSLVEKIDSDLAAIALPIIVKIALLDQKINQQENDIINTLLAMVE